MRTKSATRSNNSTTAAKVRELVLSSRDRIWTYSDFGELPMAAVSQALSRLARNDELQRVRKGVYYRPKQTIIGISKASETALATKVLSTDAGLRPAGITAAQVLGMTTQNPVQTTYAVSRSKAPTGLPGIKVKTRRPSMSIDLSPTEAAILEFLRDRGQTSELSPEQTVKRLLGVVIAGRSFGKLAKVAEKEPSRVRALLGAIGQEIGAEEAILLKLRRSLNGLSRFDFGKLAVLQHAKEWQSK